MGLAPNPDGGRLRIRGMSAAVVSLTRTYGGDVFPFRRPIRSNEETAIDRPGLNQMMERVAVGSEHAFGQLYDELSPMVYGIVLRIVRDPAMSEEVTQEIFIELWRTAPNFDHRKGKVKSWAATIAHRRAVDRVRSEEASRRRDSDESDVAERFSASAEETVERSFETERVRRELGKLTEAQREAIVLAYYRGLTYREVAVLLDLPEGTVKTRIRDGMIRLRDNFGVGSDD